jgi:hypothetical protein
MRNLLTCILLLLTAGPIAGCGSQSPESYKTEENHAREALQSALDTWKAGKPAGEVGPVSAGPKVQVIDSDWTAGKRLTAYEITEELPGADSVARRFSVKLTYEKQPQAVPAEYSVVGIDPILVFRDKDYNQSQGM